MTLLTVIGMDPGLANFGWCVAEIGEVVRVRAMGVWVTKKATKRQNVRSSADAARRAAELAEQIATLHAGNEPHAYLIEAFSAARNASSAAKTARAFGVIDALAYVNQVPVFEVGPQAIKKKVAGVSNASKAQVAAGVRHLCTEQALAMLPRATTKWEHAFDAVGAVVTAVALPEFRMMKAVHR